MKTKIIVFALSAVLIISCTGCAKQIDKADNSTAYSSDSEIQTVLDEPSSESEAEAAEETDILLSGVTEVSETECDTTTEIATEQSEPIITVPESTVEQTNKSHKSEITQPEQPKETNSLKTEEPITPVETAPEVTVDPVIEPESSTEPKPTPEPEPEPEPEPSFDIDYWVSYGKSYAQSIGLELDSTATECWDNPISANAKLTNIGENLVSRLKRYKNVDGFTAVWIWAVKVSDNGYQIYIGYA